MAPPAKPFMLTPLVIAMPKPMAEALGWPDEADRLRRHPRPRPATRAGGRRKGHPEWGPFRLGKTNPNFSTSGLNCDDRPVLRGHRQDPRPHARGPRPARGRRVSHVGSSRPSCTTATPRSRSSTTCTAADARGTALTYASAVAVEEKSVIDYNTGNPDGILDPGEEPRAPRAAGRRSIRRRARSSPTTPFIVLDAPWVTRRAEAGAPRVRGLRHAAREPAAGA